jgi:hypothetical protein
MNFRLPVASISHMSVARWTPSNRPRAPPTGDRVPARVEQTRTVLLRRKRRLAGDPAFLDQEFVHPGELVPADPGEVVLQVLEPGDVQLEQLAGECAAQSLGLLEQFPRLVLAEADPLQRTDQQLGELFGGLDLEALDHPAHPGAGGRVQSSDRVGEGGDELGPYPEPVGLAQDQPAEGVQRPDDDGRL